MVQIKRETYRSKLNKDLFILVICYQAKIQLQL